MGAFDRADRGLARVAEHRAVGGEEIRLERPQRAGLPRRSTASPLRGTSVSTSVKPSSSRTRYAFTKRSLVSWIRLGVI